MSTGGHVATGGHTATGGSFDGGTAPSWPKKFCGNITTQNKVDPPGLNYARHWDQITPENAGKWGSVQPGPSAAFNWATLDAIYAYAEQHNIPFKEHSFVWGAAQPAGTYTSATVENWIKSYCERYPKTSLIDVVNEPPPHTIPTYAKILGEGESGTYPWIVKAFKLARLHCGNAVLILNDYDNLAYASSQAHYIDIVNNVRANGGPIDALGIQAHDASKLTTSQLQASLDTLSAQTGLPIYITEYDISLSKDEEQLAIFQEQFPIFWQSKAVRGVTVWGWIMGYTWVSNSGLVRETTPRPAMTWLMNYLGRPSTP
jgi:endo-1,4-beta-xylanase